MRPIDADALMEEFKKNDLSFMQQGDVMDCLKDIIDRMPTVTGLVPKVNISENPLKITIDFDNKKTLDDF